MAKILTLLLIAISLGACAQQSLDTYTANNIKINVGDTVALGTGTRNNGSFTSVFLPSISSGEVLSAAQLKKDYANKKFVLTDIRQFAKGDKNIVFGVAAVVTDIKNSEIKEYFINFEKGFTLGEITGVTHNPNYVRPTPVVKEPGKKVEAPEKGKIALTPGKHLIKAGNHFYVGICLSVIGSGISTSGFFVDPDSGQALEALGAGVGVIGIIYMLSSWSHIIKAGKGFEELKIGATTLNFGIQPHGIGISMNF